MSANMNYLKFIAIAILAVLALLPAAEGKKVRKTFTALETQEERVLKGKGKGGKESKAPKQTLK